MIGAGGLVSNDLSLIVKPKPGLFEEDELCEAVNVMYILLFSASYWKRDPVVPDTVMGSLAVNRLVPLFN